MSLTDLRYLSGYLAEHQMAITLSERNTGITMKISKVLCGLALLPFLAGAALAETDQPVPAGAPSANQTSPMGPASKTNVSPKHKPQVLADAQMDNVTAGTVGLDVLNDNLAEGNITSAAPLRIMNIRAEASGLGLRS
jgi:hypothetical protein